MTEPALPSPCSENGDARSAGVYKTAACVPISTAARCAPPRPRVAPGQYTQQVLLNPPFMRLCPRRLTRPPCTARTSPTSPGRAMLADRAARYDPRPELLRQHYQDRRQAPQPHPPDPGPRVHHHHHPLPHNRRSYPGLTSAAALRLGHFPVSSTQFCQVTGLAPGPHTLLPAPGVRFWELNGSGSCCAARRGGPIPGHSGDRLVGRFGSLGQRG